MKERHYTYQNLSWCRGLTKWLPQDGQLTLSKTIEKVFCYKILRRTALKNPLPNSLICTKWVSLGAVWSLIHTITAKMCSGNPIHMTPRRNFILPSKISLERPWGMRCFPYLLISGSIKVIRSHLSDHTFAGKSRRWARTMYGMMKQRFREKSLWIEKNWQSLISSNSYSPSFRHTLSKQQRDY